MISVDDQQRQLGFRNILILATVAALLYGPAVFSGRPLSVHEARLPELAREMVWSGGSWLLPTSGGRPWLERPPLPHWITAWSMMFLGRVGSLWSARLPAAVAGFIVGLCAAIVSARTYGKAFGLLAGVVTLSSFEIYQYATLAEDDIYLAALTSAAVTCFVVAQFSGRPRRYSSTWRMAINGRPLSTVLFFVVLGLTNLAKGPLVGAVPIIAALGVYLLIARDWRGLQHYAWLWGWLIFATLTLSWPVWAVRHYPDVIDNWRFDYLGQSNVGNSAAAHDWDHPWWYYGVMLPVALAPWIWATPIGLAATLRRAMRFVASPSLFFWCWAIVPIILLSVPQRKHHQYLTPVLAPWSILSAVGLVRVQRWLLEQRSRLTLTMIVSSVLLIGVAASATIQIGWAGRDPETLAELRLVERAKAVVPPGEPLIVNADTDSIAFFRIEYMLRHDHRLIQNLSYLHDPALRRPAMYVWSSLDDKPYLQTLGHVRVLASQREMQPQKHDRRFAIFELIPRNLEPIPPLPVSVMQAMDRAPGPWLGPPPPRSVLAHDSHTSAYSAAR